VLNEISPAGFSAVQWNGKNTSGQNVHSGVYFVKLKAGSFSEVKKVLLIK
jgi:flagellar hook assembly protein FlgD